MSDNILKNISIPLIKKINPFINNHIFTFHKNEFNNRFSSKDIITQAIHKMIIQKNEHKSFSLFY